MLVLPFFRLCVKALKHALRAFVKTKSIFTPPRLHVSTNTFISTLTNLHIYSLFFVFLHFKTKRKQWAIF